MKRSGTGIYGKTSDLTGVRAENPLLDEKDIVLKKILSLREHYDLEDLRGRKLGESDGNLVQHPARPRSPTRAEPQ